MPLSALERAYAAWRIVLITDPEVRRISEDPSIGPAELERSLRILNARFIQDFLAHDEAQRAARRAARSDAAGAARDVPETGRLVASTPYLDRLMLQQLQEDCIICREEFAPARGTNRPAINVRDPRPGDPVRLLPCGHIFHKHCADMWRTRSNTCPTCRAVITGRGRYYAGGSAGRTGRYIFPRMTGRGRYLPYTSGPYRRIVLR